MEKGDSKPADIPEIEQSWNKVKSISIQSGLRDGISDGRDNNFQKSFDVGYRDGFKNGLLLGKNKGSLMASSKLNNVQVALPPLLEKTTKGDCVVCDQSNLLEKEEEYIQEIQDKQYKRNVEKLTQIILQHNTHPVEAQDAQ